MYEKKGFDFLIELLFALFEINIHYEQKDTSTYQMGFASLLHVIHCLCSKEVPSYLFMNTVIKVLSHYGLDELRYVFEMQNNFIHLICLESGSNVNQKCMICFSEDSKELLKCDHCQLVSYCSLEHKEEHWEYHQLGCDPLLRFEKKTISELFPTDLCQIYVEPLICGYIRKCNISFYIPSDIISVICMLFV